MRLRTLYTSVFLAAAWCTQAHAAKNVEIVRYPSLLMMGPINQSLSVAYSYSQHTTGGSSSSGSALKENYSLDTTAAILDPHLASLQILGGLSYSQNFSDKTATLFDTEYNVVGSLFDMSYHPMLVSTFRTTALVSNGYTPTYSQTNNSNQISASLLNQTLPVSVQYMNASSETDRQDASSSSSSNAFSVSTSHQYKTVSTSRLSFSHSRAESGESSTSSYSISAGNYLALDPRRRYRLSSNLNVFESKSGEVPQRNLSLSEELTLNLGKALSGRLTDHLTYNRTFDFELEKQSRTNNTISGSLSHTLYRSLSTSLSGSYSRGFGSTGETSSYGGGVAFNYQKVLPAQSNLRISMDRNRSINNQEFSTSELAERDEGHFRVNWGDRIVPLLEGTLTSVVEVKSLNQTPEIVYLEGVDYRVDFLLGEIEILSGGNIVPGTDIAISYTVAVDPTVRFQTDSMTVSSSVALFNSRYSLSASLSQQDQEVLSGTAENQSFVSSTSLALRAMANYTPTQLGLEYTLVDSNQEESWRLDAFGSHYLRTSDNASVSLSVRNSYSVQEVESSGSHSFAKNTFSVALSYSRRFFRWIKFSSAVVGSDSRSGSTYTDFVSLRGTMSGNYNQLQFSVNGQMLYRITGAGNSRDTSINCVLTRYF